MTRGRPPLAVGSSHREPNFDSRGQARDFVRPRGFARDQRGGKTERRRWIPAYAGKTEVTGMTRKGEDGFQIPLKGTYGKFGKTEVAGMLFPGADEDICRPRELLP